ncbi:MAG: hypothetical protein HFJ45_00985 [Clostridia bacterium]|nr:hypothetical protein [Clostridia bacterium]
MKKKVWLVVIVLILIILLGTIMSFCVLKSKKDKKSAKKELVDIAKIQEENIIDDNKILEEQVEESNEEKVTETLEVENQEPIKEESDISKVDNLTDNVQTINNYNVEPKEETPNVVENINSNVNLANEQNEQVVIPVYEPVIEVENNESNINDIPVQEEPIVQETEDNRNSVQEEPVMQNTEEYKYNDEMCQKIIDIINNNQNENMKKYGYNVIIDKSAVELSNPYTFSEERTLNKIKSRFGEIKVYAQDYYLNNTYISTDCYIY